MSELLMKKRREASLLSSTDSIRSSDAGDATSPDQPSAKKAKLDSLRSSLAQSADIITLDELSCPPTKEQLDKYADLDPRELPVQFKRELEDRVFVNRDLRMDKISMFGFDMDYTLAVYKSPEYERLAYNLIRNRLIELGYPKSLASLNYDPSFPIRGLWIDKKLGNLLKVGKYGNLITGYHGRRLIPKTQLVELYPAMHVSTDLGSRFAVLDTLFALPESCLFADIVDHLEFADHQAVVKATSEAPKTPLSSLKDSSAAIGAGGHSDVDPPPATPTMRRAPSSLILESHHSHLNLSFRNLHHDVRTATDHIHHSGLLKKQTLDDIERYVYRDPQRLSMLLHRMRTVAKAKVFLLTNSEWWYTDAVMKYLLDGARADHSSWRDYFDIIITSAQKPRFFEAGSTFREVDLATGNLKIGRELQGFKKGSVYCGGSLEHFSKNTGVSGNRVLYIGDHIFSDLMKSKKTTFWRTLLVMPEVSQEVKLAREAKPLQDHLINLSFIRSEVFRGLDSESVTMPDCSELHDRVKRSVVDLDRLYNQYWGSPFRTGFETTFFCMQVERFADLYTGDFLNLLNYPFFYRFSADIATSFLPHERIPIIH